MTKEETIYPTITQEGLMLSCVIDSMDDCDVYTIYITGSLFQTDTERTV